MKTKYIIVLMGCAILTLSFTVISTTHSKGKSKTEQSASMTGPVGGLSSEDPIK